MENIGPIEQAINDLVSQEMLNIKSTTNKYNIVESILQHCFKGQSVSHAEAHSRLATLFTFTQELMLIKYINKLSVCSLHLTLQLLEILLWKSYIVSLKKWVEWFCKFYDIEFKNHYLYKIN